jgi:hypothetical protein
LNLLNAFLINPKLLNELRSTQNFDKNGNLENIDKQFKINNFIENSNFGIYENSSNLVVRIKEEKPIFLI